MTRIHPDLPVFLLTRGTSNVLYAPGHLAVVTAAEAEKARAGRIAAPLRECAGRAVETWRRRLEAPFEPECLTVYFGGACDLACPYCFASAASQPAPFNEAAVLAAARLVARFSAAKRKPFHLTLHGGGEPALHWDALVRLVEATQRIARQAETGWFGYIATNGVMNGERVRWLARNVDLTGISCDGPPDIQDRQRPLAGGGASSIFVERTAGILAQMGARFAVRATITPPAVERQAEIVAYLNERLGATELRFEPVYRVEPGFAPGQAEWFLDHFLAAQREARKRGCDLQLSGTRLDEVHGPYCNVLRDVLQVAADGTAAGCFLESGAGTGIGGWDETGGEYRIDAEKIAAQRRKLAEIPARCRDCFNLYHCARDCPERCALTGAEAAPGFRCRLERLLGEAWIFEAAGRRDPLGPLLENAPPSVDRTAIREQWRAATRSYAIERRRMPLPVWARRGFEHDGAEARRHLQDVLSAAPAAPMSVYLHVPFCDRRCGFCDCYSVPLGPRSREKEVRFEQALAAEIDAWASIEALAKRRVTTVHFGGGTPNWLGASVMERILARMRERLGISAGTEWAIESRTSLLAGEHLDRLRRWGFRRLHVGIQTLEDEARKLIGRREPGETAARRVASALAAGFTVSADILFGLPRQTLCGLIATLDRLVALGVHGFSLYSLHVSARNRRFLERIVDPAAGPLRDYVLFQAASQCLARNGYRKNHFTHFARIEDRNLYYTHPQREEDLLGLGPTADGVFGSYHYRHPELEEYLRGAGNGGVALEGGLRESPLERRIRPAAAQLMGGRVSAEALQAAGATSLLEPWSRCALIEGEPAGTGFSLTANGSWFVSDMLDELSQTASLGA